MSTIGRDGETFVVDAALLSDAFGLDEEQVRQGMREGTITSRSERGEDEDAGRWRLTFHHADRACRLIVDDAGTVLKRTTFPIRSATPPPKVR